MDSPVNVSFSAFWAILDLANGLVDFGLLRGNVIGARIFLSEHSGCDDFLESAIWGSHEKDKLRVVHLASTDTETEPAVQREAHLHLQNLRVLSHKCSHLYYEVVL